MEDNKKNKKKLDEEIGSKEKKRKKRLGKTSDFKVSDPGLDIKDNDDTQTIGELFEGDDDQEPYR